MPRKIREMQLKYVTDEKGKKTAVILPIDEFEELLEDIEDMAILLERRDEPTIPFEELIVKLKKNGLLSD